MKVEIEKHGRDRVNTALQLPTHTADFGDGPRTVGPASAIMAGLVTHDHGAAVSIALLHIGSATATTIMLDSECCHGIERQLAAARRELEQQANDAANAALRKAAGK